MSNRGADSKLFGEVLRELLEQGLCVRFQARGASMSPAIRDGEIVEVTPVIVSKLRKDDIVLAKSNSGFRLHRLLFVDLEKDTFVTRGDCGQEDDPVLSGDQILGVARAKEVRIGRKTVSAEFKGAAGWALRCTARAQTAFKKLLRVGSGTPPTEPSSPVRAGLRSFVWAVGLLSLLLTVTHVRAQVVVADPSTSGSVEITGAGTGTVNFTHTTAASVNRLLVVGVSINIKNSAAAAVTGVTYNGSALGFLGAHNDTGNTRRVEMWSLLNPVAGTNLPIVVTVNVPAATTVGVVAGATTFSDVDQTVPLSAFVSADGAAGGCVASAAAGNFQCNSQLNVTSVVNGMVFDTLAVGMGAITVNGPQVSQWNVTSGGANPSASQDLVGTGSARSGAPSVPVSESFNEVLNLTAATRTGTTTVYTGTITGGANNGFVGASFVVAGFSNAANNGTFTCTASTATTLTLNNAAGVTQVHAGTATTNSTFNWSQGAISINPSVADIGVATSVGTVMVGQNTTYNITVFNNGTSAANTVALSDTLAAGMTLVSVTPSAGVTCVTTANPITCTVGTLVSGGSATVAVVETAATSGAFANTATVTDSGTPPDPNTGNNSFTAVATVQSAACAAVAQAGPGTPTGVVNSYYPGTASVLPGATSIPVGAATGAGTAIAAGNLLLVIQMQDASISTANSVAYGNGSTGAGFTALNSAGNYEFVTATNAVPATGGTLNVSGAGAGGGLVFAYDAGAVSATKGASTYQVVLVPQYTTAILPATGLTAPAWNGSTGGVLVLDASSTLTLNGAVVSVDGLGFRGGAGMQLQGGGSANTDYQQPAPATYTGVAKPGWDAPKGEGVAGTPAWVESGGTFLATGTGYPSGTAGTDGSMGRGAPGNAGGGATDADPQTASPGGNDQNAGGGGGGNGGAGGFGGDSWNTNLSTGGEGGAAFPATINRIALGGGGGGGTRNNSDGDTQASSGSAGGGIIIIRALALSGTATLTANGVAAYNNTANDGGGGGGAGGSIVVLSANGGEGGLTLSANGGRGGNAWGSQTFTLGNRHGPGGGGGGGVVLVSGPPASISVNGGANGLTENPGVPYGATAGAAGTSVTNASITSTTGTQSGAECTPDMTLGKSHVGNFVRGTAVSYTVPVSNLSPFGPSTGAVTINDTLPTGLTPVSAVGAGWGCSVAAQTITCVRSDSLAGSSSYPTITVNANVAQTAPSTVTNTALVSGGGEINLANDTATDVANVVSSADLSVTNIAVPNPVAAGTNITYTQVVTNNGPSAADNATLVATIPTNTTFVSIASPAGWTCFTPVGNSNLVCSTANMAGSTAATFTLVVRVNNATPNGTVITETASVSSSASDPNSSNNSATATTIVGATAGGELTITNSASPNPVIAGNNITYTQIVTNTGSAAATGASFSEATPANTTLVSITPPAGWNCAGFPGVPCSNPSVAAGSSGIFTAIYQVNVGTASGTVITDTATVNAGNQAFGPNSATATDVVATAGQADVALSTAGAPSAVIAGNNITYTQIVTNNGPAAASGVTFTEAIPANTTFVSVSPPVGWSCTVTASVTCTDPNPLAAGAEANIIVVVNVGPAIAVATITANSSVSATTSDPTPANNSTTVVTTVNTSCDLTVTNSGSPSPVAAGANITYTQTVFNHGQSNCSTATLTEPTPANTTFVSVSVVTAGGGTWTCPNVAPVSCTNPSVPPGSTGTITAIYKVNAGTAAGTIITDTDTGASTTHDTNLTDNSATVKIAVAVAGQADLSVTNSGSPNPVTAGNNITYTQVVANGGPAAASTITLSETTPANTVAQSLTGPAGWTCNLGTLTCTNPTLAVNATATFTFVVKVNANVASGSTITQTASVTPTAGDPNPANNTASASVQVANSGDLSVTNTASPVPVIAGANITYTQTATNAGPSAATGASLTENTPPNTTFQSIAFPAAWSCVTPAVGAAGTITCTNPSFAPGAASFTVVVKVTAGTAAGTAINDTVSVSSSTTDPNLANNSATAADVVATAGEADLVVTNVAAPTSVAAGSNVTYTQSVTNDGPSATSTPPTFTQSVPPNMNFRSIAFPAGWSCVIPAVGGTGNITCTDSSNLALNATATFTLVLQVNAGTASGTNIGETVTANTNNIVPNSTTKSATATIVVANANSADMAITKTATPNPVPEGDPLTYTLGVTNNGPATATNVTVTDTLPSTMTFLSATTTTGTCSEAGGTVTCLLGTIASAGTATITILVMPGTPGVFSNTANVSADQTDPNPNNNSSTQNETVTAPTSIQLQSFTAHAGIDAAGAPRVVLTWKTGGEAQNFGFNVYREQNGARVRLNPSLIAGSALLMRGALPKHSGKTYAWIDSSGAGTDTYWLEDVGVNGTRVMHGPIAVDPTPAASGDSIAAPATTFSQIKQAQGSAAATATSHPIEATVGEGVPSASQIQKQFELAGHAAVKILVRHEGWHRITQPELVKAGLDANVDPASLHLFAEALEKPLEITGATAGPGGFGPQAAINFYGTGIDTLYSGTRVYWLVAGENQGARIRTAPPSTGSNLPPASFPYMVELKQRTTYFAALITPNGDNFFGDIVSPAPLLQSLQAPHLDKKSNAPAWLEVTLQGVIVGMPHDVSVELNGTNVGNVTFTGQAKGTLRVELPSGLLLNGSNTVTLTAQNGDFDTSLVDYIRIMYPHSYEADSDKLRFSGRAGDEITVGGFTGQPSVVLDITDPDQPVRLTPQVVLKDGKYEIAVQVPWTSTSSADPARHTLLAVAEDRVLSAAGVRANHPSHWHSAQGGAEIAMISHEAFEQELQSLVRAHHAEGLSSVVVPITDLYDEFNFGEHSPYVIRQFLRRASMNWRTAPKYLLLNGRASIDPRNYLGFGYLDFVPTKIVPSSSLMTASDDWFSDFNNTGMPTIPTGRLPVSSADEAKTVIGKIFNYEGQSTNGPWTSRAMMVADQNDTENFTQDAQTVQAQLPSTLQVTDVFRSTVGSAAATEIVSGINSGQVLVDYLGHGSEDQWSGSNIFDTKAVASLTNGSQLPVFLIMDCLNGLFQDVIETPLAVTLVLAPNGGGVAVLASSGLNQAPPQTMLDKIIVQSLFSTPQPTLGEAMVQAKSQITDPDVRRTYILFGDPAMRIKTPSMATPRQ